ncbi:MAG: hypothetical protein WCJ49_02155, partial [Deltaproteobacteria bacterium]
MLIFFSFVVTLLMGIGVITWFLPNEGARPTAGRFVLYISLAFGIGVGFTSIMLFIYLHFFPIKSYPIVECCVLSVLALVVIVYFRRSLFTLWVPQKSEAMGLFEKTLAFIFFISLFLACFAFVTYFPIEPHGEWDAWATWNNGARFIYLAGDNFIPNYKETHETLGMLRTYPMLYPLSTARAWAYNGEVSQVAPVMFNGLFVLASIGVVFGLLQTVKSRMAGWFGALFLLGTPFLMLHALGQYADVPLSYFFVSTCAVFAMTPDVNNGHEKFML